MPITDTGQYIIPNAEPCLEAKPNPDPEHAGRSARSEVLC